MTIMDKCASSLRSPLAIGPSAVMPAACLAATSLMPLSTASPGAGFAVGAACAEARALTHWVIWLGSVVRIVDSGDGAASDPASAVAPPAPR